MNTTNLENTIQEFENLRIQINRAQFGDFQINRGLFNQLKTRLIENGFDLEVITIDHQNNFFTPPDNNLNLYGNPQEKFKDDQGKLASLCTKAIRDLGKKVSTIKNVPTQPQEKIITKIEKVYPPTSWKLIRSGLFWTIFGLLLTLFSALFYYLGQNSKDKENVDLLMQISEKNNEIKELNKNLENASFDIENKQKEINRLEAIIKTK